MKPEEIRSVVQLVREIEKGSMLKFLFFWGHTPKVPGRLDQSCLSNWYPAEFSVDEDTYPTTEHYMMAEKARLFGDTKVRQEILDAKSPGEAKALGRKVSNFDEETWIEHRFGIVVFANFQKFKQNSEMGELLLRTGNKVLVEASPRDRIWGIGMGKNHVSVEDPKQWRGLNLLGFALMEVRHRLNGNVEQVAAGNVRSCGHPLRFDVQ